MPNNDEDKRAILASLKQSTERVLNEVKPSEFADSEFMQTLSFKLEERNVDPRVVEFISTNPNSIHTNYDVQDAEHVEILNNKVEQIYQLFVEDSERVNALSQKQQKLIKRIFGSKN